MKIEAALSRLCADGLYRSKEGAYWLRLQGGAIVIEPNRPPYIIPTSALSVEVDPTPLAGTVSLNVKL